MPNHYVGDLLRTMAISGRSRERTGSHCCGIITLIWSWARHLSVNGLSTHPLEALRGWAISAVSERVTATLNLIVDPLVYFSVA